MKFQKQTYQKIFIISLISLLSLSACTIKQHTSKKKDGAPKFNHINLLKVPDAVPKSEPLSRYGNRFGKNGNSNTYVALKKRYRVLSTSRGYKARGIASWYGTQFHGRRTSNGERYNMFAMTAAHPTLPLPTYAKVTNLENGKSVIVKINDRGPFHKNRLIDLSYVAAAKLGLLKKGIARVEVESIDPRDHGKDRLKVPALAVNQKSVKKSSVPTKIATLSPILASSPPKSSLPNPPLIPSSKPKIYLQLGKFDYRGKAEVLITKIKKISSIPTYIYQHGTHHAPIFRVRIGPLPNEEEAIKLTQKMTQARLPTPIVIKEHS